MWLIPRVAAASRVVSTPHRHKPQVCSKQSGNGRGACWVLSCYICAKRPCPASKGQSLFVMMPSSSSRRGGVAGYLPTLLACRVSYRRSTSSCIDYNCPSTRATSSSSKSLTCNRNISCLPLSYLLCSCDRSFGRDISSTTGCRCAISKSDFIRSRGNRGLFRQSCRNKLCISIADICLVNCLSGFFELCSENGDRDGNEDGDDRNDDQELGQGKALVVFLHLVSPYHSDLLVGIRIDRQTWFQ